MRATTAARRVLFEELAMLVLGSLVALLVGATVGLLGGGGATLMLPLLVYGFGLAPHAAIAGSLAVVCATSLVGALVHARHGRVDVRVAVAFGGASTAAAYLGGLAAGRVPAEILIALFAVAMLASAWRMLVSAPCAAPVADPPRWLLVAVAAAVGGFAGLVGAGGGFLVVPALVLVGRVPMHRAAATSLAVIAAQSAAGLAGHLGHAELDPALLGGLAALSATGAIAGAALASRFAAASLRRGFAVLLLAVAALFLQRQLPPGWASWSAVVAVLTIGATLWWRTRPRLAGPAVAAA
jgi:uncharacterized protein